jgi:hypothetical protein
MDLNMWSVANARNYVNMKKIFNFFGSDNAKDIENFNYSL